MNNKWVNWIGLSAFALLVVLVLIFSGRGFKFDEPYYLSNIDLLKQYGLSAGFIIHLRGPAGPTYAVLHYLFSPLTQLKVIPVRLLNAGFLVCIIYFLNRVLRKSGLPAVAFGILFIPMTFVCAGMALTEMPALLFLVLSIFFLQKFVEADRWLFLIAAAITYSASILGRQPYLLLLPVFLLYAFYPINLKAAGRLFVFLVVSLAVPLYCFYLWRGLIPQTGRIAEEGGFVYAHFFLACGYAFLAFLFTSPSFIIPPRKIGYRLLVLVFIVLVAVSVYFNLQYGVLNALAKRVLPGKVFGYFLNLSFGLLMFLSFYFIVGCTYRLAECYRNPVLLLSFLCLFILLLSTITITHQFSSRYVFQLSPFILLVGARYSKAGLYSQIARISGILLGVSSLISYFLSTY